MNEKMLKQLEEMALEFSEKDAEASRSFFEGRLDEGAKNMEQSKELEHHMHLVLMLALGYDLEDKGRYLQWIKQN